MGYTRRPLALVAFFLALGTIGGAQTPTTVAERIGTAMATQQVGWQLDASKVLVTDKSFMQLWENRAEDIVIDYQEHASQTAADEFLDAVPDTMSIGGGQPLAGVGDEAMIWARVTVDGGATIHFRKNKATVRVSAPWEAKAMQIAQLVADQIYP